MITSIVIGCSCAWASILKSVHPHLEGLDSKIWNGDNLSQCICFVWRLKAADKEEKEMTEGNHNTHKRECRKNFTFFIFFTQWGAFHFVFHKHKSPQMIVHSCCDPGGIAGVESNQIVLFTELFLWARIKQQTAQTHHEDIDVFVLLSDLLC